MSFVQLRSPRLQNPLANPLIVVGNTGQVKVWSGSLFVAKPIKVWNGSIWVIKPIKQWNGTTWVLTNY